MLTTTILGRDVRTSDVVELNPSDEESIVLKANEDMGSGATQWGWIRTIVNNIRGAMMTDELKG